MRVLQCTVCDVHLCKWAGGVKDRTVDYQHVGELSRTGCSAGERENYGCRNY